MAIRNVMTLGLSVLLLLSCTGKQQSSLSKSARLLMGTLVEITLAGNEEKRKAAERALFEEIKRVEDLTSFHKPSEITRINDLSGKGPTKADPEILQLVSEALKVAEQTNGAFDPTIGPVSRLWHFSGETEARVPAESEIKEALTKVGWSRVKIDPSAGTIDLTVPGMALDLGGIAKGYTLNRCAQIIKNSGLAGALVNIGGDIVAMGEREPGRPWRVGVEDPRNKSGIVAVTVLKDQMIVTSGDYERFFLKDGKRYHHILDPGTGYPADKMRSVSVVGPLGAVLQPCGTAAFVVGTEKGLRLVQSIQGAEGFFIDAQGAYHFTDKGKSVFEAKP